VAPKIVTVVVGSTDESLGVCPTSWFCGLCHITPLQKLVEGQNKLSRSGRENTLGCCTARKRPSVPHTTNHHFQKNVSWNLKLF